MEAFEAEENRLEKVLLEKDYNLTIIDNFFHEQNSPANISSYKKLDIINSDFRNFPKYNKKIEIC